MPTVMPADDAILERILETTYPTSHQGLSRSAFTKLDAAQRKTIWGLGHQRRFALVEQDECWPARSDTLSMARSIADA